MRDLPLQGPWGPPSPRPPRLRAALIGLLLAVMPVHAQAAARAQASASARSGDVEAVRAAALRLHEEHHYADAAALLERLAAETGRSDLLFDAGQARFAAGHRAHALRLWQTYAEGRGRSPEDIALASRRIADARALTAPITILIHVPSDMSISTVTARRLRDPADDVRPAVTIDVSRLEAVGSAVVALDPGVWELVVVPAAGEPVRSALVVGRAPQTVELTLVAPAPPPAPIARPAPVLPRQARRSRSIPLLALASVSLASGTALAVLRTRSFDSHLGICAIGRDQPLCSEAALLGDARFAGAGAGLIGAGVGLLVAGITAAVPVRRRVWLTEVLGGGAALALGLAWLGAENLAYGRATTNDDYLARARPWFDRRAVAASLLGAGVGLGLGAAAGLWLPARRVGARTSMRPALGLASVGLTAVF